LIFGRSFVTPTVGKYINEGSLVMLIMHRYRTHGVFWNKWRLAASQGWIMQLTDQIWRHVTSFYLAGQLFDTDEELLSGVRAVLAGISGELLVSVPAERARRLETSCDTGGDDSCRSTMRRHFDSISDALYK
jgi:hypothetical protein